MKTVSRLLSVLSAVVVLSAVSHAQVVSSAPAVTSGGVRSLYTGLAGLSQIVYDSHGNLLYADDNDNAVYQISPSGNVTQLQSGLGGVQSLALDAAGNLYVAAPYASTPVLEKVPYSSGAYQVGSAVDLTANLGSLDGGYIQPIGVAVDPVSGKVYFSESYCSSCNSQYYIFSVNSDGTSPAQFYGPLPGGSAALNLALDQYGNLSYGDHTALYTLNVNATTPVASVLLNESTNGASVDAAGDLIVSLGQVSPYDTVLIPNESGSLNANDQYIVAGNTYSQYADGVNPVTGQFYSGDGYNTGQGTIRSVWLNAAAMGASPVGTPVYGTAASFNFNSTSTPATVNVFNYNNFSYGGSSCAAQTYTAGSYCTLYVNFTPTQVGVLNGSLYMQDASYNLLATLYTTGIGTGPQLTVAGGDNGQVLGSTTLLGPSPGTGLSAPAAVAVDFSDNIYIADTGNARIVKQAFGSTSPSLVAVNGTTLTDPTGIAVDAAFNIYVTDGTANQVIRVNNFGGPATTLISSSFQANSLGLSNPSGIAVDGLGNAFVSDTGNNRILRVPSYGTPVVLISPTVTAGGTALSNPHGIAVDGYDNLYIADTGNNRIVEYNSTTQTMSVVATGGTNLSAPTGVAVDAAGDIYVTDNSGVTGFFLEGSTQHVAVTAPLGVALDMAGNVFVADTQGNSVTDANTSTGSSVSFGSVPTGTTATKTIYIYNTGNAPDTLTTVPAIDASDANFSINSTTCTTSAVLTPGASCAIVIGFTPATSGNVTGSITVTNDTFHTTQTITLNGTVGAALPISTTTLLSNVAPVVAGGTASLSATVTPSQSSQASPSGNVTFSSNGTVLGTAPLVSGTATLNNVSTAGYPAGTYPVVAVYQGDSNFAGSISNTVEVTITPTATTTTATLTASSVVRGQNATVSGTVSGVSSGTVSIYQGLNLIATAPIVSGSYTYTASTQPLAAGSYTITVQYAGGSTTAASSAQATLTVTLPATSVLFTITPSTVAQGQSFNADAVISGGTGAGTYTGTVSFYAGNGQLVITSSDPNNATATYNATGSLAPGTYSGYAVYSGDAYNAGSVSNTATITITAQ